MRNVQGLAPETQAPMRENQMPRMMLTLRTDAPMSDAAHRAVRFYVDGIEQPLEPRWSITAPSDLTVIELAAMMVEFGLSCEMDGSDQVRLVPCIGNLNKRPPSAADLAMFAMGNDLPRGAGAARICWNVNSPGAR